MPAATSIMAAAAVASAGVGIYTALNQPKPPRTQPPPPPADCYMYNDDGSVDIQQWDAEKNAYVTKLDAEPSDRNSEEHAAWGKRKEARETETRSRQEIRERFLSNLNKTPEDRVKAYEEYATNFSSAMQRGVDEQFEKTRSSTDESMSARGMYGSRAYADMRAELEKEKLGADVEIAERAALAKEDLSRQDRDYWMGGLTALDAGRHSQEISAGERTRRTMLGAQQGTAASMGRHQAEYSDRWNEWQAKILGNQQLSSTMMDTASGLAYIYGYKGNKKKDPLAPNPTSSQNYNTGPSYA